MAVDPPAPGTKMKGSGRSMFGQQVDSQKTTQPTYTFSHSSTRDQSTKLFLSQAHANAEQKGLAFKGDSYDYSSVEKQVVSTKTNPPKAAFSHAERMPFKGSEVPGPGTYPAPSSLGSQASSSRTSPPKTRFGSSTRDKNHSLFLSSEHQAHEHKGVQGPPPGSYADNLPGAIGSQVLSSRRNSPAFAITKADRLKDEFVKRSQSLPAAGQYETWTAIGKQPLSQFRTLPAYGFRGTSNWDTESKRYLTSSHTESLKGTLSPNNYDSQTDATLTSFGKQALSQRSSVPSPKLYGSERFATFRATDSPGPGQYA